MLILPVYLNIYTANCFFLLNIYSAKIFTVNFHKTQKLFTQIINWFYFIIFPNIRENNKIVVQPTENEQQINNCFQNSTTRHSRIRFMARFSTKIK